MTIISAIITAQTNKLWGVKMAISRLSTYDPNGWFPIYIMFTDLFISGFRYDGMPEEIDTRYLELALLQNGKCAFFFDEIAERYVALKCTGQLNIYNEPVKLSCIGANGYNKTKTNYVDSVLMYNNFSHESPISRLETYARRIHAIENTSDINVNAQKTPYLIVGSKDQEFTLKKIYAQLDDFKPAIFIDKGLDKDTIKVMKTDAPYVVDKLEDQKRKLMNEALSYIGIDNNSSEKNERLLMDEIMVSNGLAIANRNSRMQTREIAIQKINKMFGLNISVSFNNPSFFADPYGDRKLTQSDVDNEGEMEDRENG